MHKEVQTVPRQFATERQRLQLDFTPEAFARLEEIRVQAKARSNAEVVRSSLRLFEWFLQRTKEGYTLQLAKDDLVKEVEIVL